MGKSRQTRREQRLARREAKAARKLGGSKKALGEMRDSGPADDGLFDDCPICLALRALEGSGAARRLELPEGVVHDLGDLGLDVIASEPGALRARAS